MGWRLKQRWRQLFWDGMPGIYRGCKAELTDERAKLLLPALAEAHGDLGRCCGSCPKLRPTVLKGLMFLGTGAGGGTRGWGSGSQLGGLEQLWAECPEPQLLRGGPGDTRGGRAGWGTAQAGP